MRWNGGRAGHRGRQAAWRGKGQDRKKRGEGRGDIHNAGTAQPDEAHQPPLRRVAAQAAPAEHEVEAEARPGDEGSEEHQEQRGCVV